MYIHLSAQAEKVHLFPSLSLFKDTDNIPYSLKCRTRQVSGGQTWLEAA